MGFAAARDALFAGEIVNPSEGRAADACRRARQRRAGRASTSPRRGAQRMRALVDAIEAGAFGDVTGILHIGIGGSALGPALLVDALGRDVGDARRALPVEHRRRGVRRCGEAARSGDDPGRRRVEDLHHRRDADQPRRGAGVAARRRRRRSRRPGDRGDRQARSGGRAGRRRNPHPASSARASAAAIRCGRRSAYRPRWRSAGMRSRHCSKARPRWTAISASPTPREQRAAARRLRRPLLCRAAAAARRARVFAYDERLRLLPFYLQQLEMESNGKSVTTRRQAGRHADRAGHLGRHRHRRAARGVPAAPPGHASSCRSNSSP